MFLLEHVDERGGEGGRQFSSNLLVEAPEFSGLTEKEKGKKGKEKKNPNSFDL